MAPCLFGSIEEIMKLLVHDVGALYVYGILVSESRQIRILPAICSNVRAESTQHTLPKMRGVESLKDLF